MARRAAQPPSFNRGCNHLKTQVTQNLLPYLAVPSSVVHRSMRGVETLRRAETLPNPGPARPVDLSRLPPASRLLRTTGPTILSRASLTADLLGGSNQKIETAMLTADSCASTGPRRRGSRDCSQL